MENLKKRDIILSFRIGLVGAIVFLFAFPGFAIPTIMHEILKLQGPGIVFGFIVGPFIIMCSLIAHGLIKKKGIALITSTIFAILISILIFIFDIQMPKHGKFGSIEFVVGVIIMAISIELVLYLLSKKTKIIKYNISAISANINISYLFYDFHIFTNSTK